MSNNITERLYWVVGNSLSQSPIIFPTCFAVLRLPRLLGPSYCFHFLINSFQFTKYNNSHCFRSQMSYNKLVLMILIDNVHALVSCRGHSKRGGGDSESKYTGQIGITKAPLPIGGKAELKRGDTAFSMHCLSWYSTFTSFYYPLIYLLSYCTYYDKTVLLVLWCPCKSTELVIDSNLHTKRNTSR